MKLKGESPDLDDLDGLVGGRETDEWPEPGLEREEMLRELVASVKGRTGISP